MENNIKVFRVHRALSWLYGVMICVVILFVVLMRSDGVGVGELIAPVLIIGIFFLLHHFVAKGAKEKKDWAKIASAIIGIIMLVGFPIGTLIGIYLLINNSGWESSSVQNT